MLLKVKVEVRKLAYMSRTQAQQCLTISEVAADFYEGILQPVGPTVQLPDIPLPQSSTWGLYRAYRKLLLSCSCKKSLCKWI